MGKTLVIAEKPSVGKELAAVLGARNKQDGAISGTRYIVTWSLGHLVTLADPEHYGEKYKKWTPEQLPMLPPKMETIVIKETRKQFNVVKSLINSSGVDDIIIATDSGREGELVARWILEKSGCRKPVKRLWISSQTEKAIKEGFSKLKPAKEYDNLYHAALCRAEADWIVGLNVTRALTCKHNAQLSAGRVQTPTLYMIVSREEEIRKFVPKEYYYVTAQMAGFFVTWPTDKGPIRGTFDLNRAQQVLEKIKGQKGKVVELKKEYKREQPPLLYDLTELQRDANKRYSFSAKQTLQIMQKLYEVHKLVTYPRTDSRYLTEDVFQSIPERLKSISVGDYKEIAVKHYRNRPRMTKRIVDASKVTDHHAIIPTEQMVNLGQLDSQERLVYDLIVRRFLAALSSDYEYERTTVKVQIAGEMFSARGKVTKQKGWKELYEKHRDPGEEEDEQALPTITNNGVYPVTGAKLNKDKTKPPARYTEATLLGAMENPGKMVDNAKAREILNAGKGLGTPATRAEIIERLFSAFYCERRGKEIVPTSKGIQLIDIVPPQLKSPELTAQWEEQLMLISQGKVDYKGFDRKIRQYAKQLVGDCLNSTSVYRHDNKTTTRCPECDKYMLEVTGKHGKMLICQDRECGFRKNLTKTSNARCPECHKKLEIYGEGDGRRYICHTCGFKEKFDMFNKRFEETKNAMSKRELASYMSKQEREKTINTSLADALSQLKLD